MQIKNFELFEPYQSFPNKFDIYMKIEFGHRRNVEEKINKDL